MARLNADKLNKRLEQLNQEQRAVMEKLVEELLGELQESSPVPKRADQAKASSRAAQEESRSTQRGLHRLGARHA